MNKLNVLSALRIKSSAEISDSVFKKIKTVSVLPKIQSFDSTMAKSLLPKKRRSS